MSKNSDGCEGLTGKPATEPKKAVLPLTPGKHLTEGDLMFWAGKFGPVDNL